MIADFEQGGAADITQQGRNGVWYTVADSNGSNVLPSNPFTPTAGSGSGGSAGVSVYGTTGTVAPIFASLQGDFTNPAAQYNIPGNVPSATGFVFDIIGTAPATVWFSVSDASTSISGNTAGMNVTVTSSWTPVTVFFDRMRTQNWGPVSVVGIMFDPTTAISFSWKVTTPSTAFGFAIDNFQFTTAAAPPVFTATPTPNPVIIDDFEDGDTQIMVQNGRNGYWSTSADIIGSTVGTSSGTTVFGLTAPGANSSAYCARITGTLAQPSGTTYPFAAMQANFVTVGNYNISAANPSYTGVVFNMKATFAGLCFNPYVRFMIGDATTTPSTDSNGVNITLPSGTWTPVTVFFNQMITSGRSTGITQTHPLDTTTAFNVQWQVTYPGAAYDVSVDDIQFITTAPPTPANPLPGSPGWPLALIDNCEQGVNNCLLNQGRGGPWFIYADNVDNGNTGTDTICPRANHSPMIMNTGGNAGSTLYAARITGVGMPAVAPYPNPGMGVHFLPADINGKDQVYDMTAAPGWPYTGFQFYAKVGAGSQTAVIVQGAEGSTDPSIAASTCATGGTGSSSICNANHCFTITATTTWQKYNVLFTQMVNPSWNTMNPQLTFLPSNSVGIQWQLATGAYDLWVDDISFY